MKAEGGDVPRLESMLAGVLHYGTGLATTVIGVGVTLVLAKWHPDSATLTGAHIITLGIGLLILLPILRVVLMLIVFVRERDYRFIAISATVLIIILAGFALGMHLSKPPPPVKPQESTR